MRQLPLRTTSTVYVNAMKVEHQKDVRSRNLDSAFDGLQSYHYYTGDFF